VGVYNVGIQWLKYQTDHFVSALQCGYVVGCVYFYGCGQLSPAICALLLIVSCSRRICGLMLLIEEGHLSIYFCASNIL